MQSPTASRFFPLLVTVAAALGCAGSSSPARTTSTAATGYNAKAEPMVSHLQGRWTMSLRGPALVAHDRVPLKIEINGTHVLGKFAADKGKIDGELKGNVIEGSWEESDGNGNFKWVLSPDGKTFQGTFGGMLHSQKVPEGATWSGVHE